MKAMAYVSALMSLVIPGSGQLLQLRVGDAVLYAFLVFWMRLSLAGVALVLKQPEIMGDAFFAGAIAIEGVARAPVAVVFTVVVVIVHLWAAWDAYNHATCPADTSREARRA